MPIKIYLSSPADVRAERDAVVSVVGRLQHDPMIGRVADVQLLSWDHTEGRVPELISENPQHSINDMLAKPSACHIVVVILWSRLGTPVPADVGARPDGSRYASGTEWEVADATTAAGRRPDVVVYRKSVPPTVALDDPELPAKREQLSALRSYVARLSEDLRQRGTGSIQAFGSLDEFRRRVDHDLRSLIARRVRSSSAVSPDAWWDPARSPYRGLVTLTPADEGIFFGRDAEVDDLVEMVQRQPLVTVVGPSGSGKSSLIGAGLIPRLRVGRQALRADADRPRWVTPEFEVERGSWRGPRLSPAALLDQPAGAVVEQLRDRALSGGDRVLLFVDQFEEAFTMLDATAGRELIDAVVALAEDEPTTVVLSLRADYLGHALEHDGLARHLRSAMLPIGPPGLSAVQDMIEGPAKVAGLRLDDDLAESLLVDAGREPGRLPLLAFALSELYRLRDGRRLTMTGYESIGGLQGAVGRLAEQTFERLQPAVRDEVGALFRQLVGVDEVGGPVRRRARLGVLRAEPNRRRLVDALVAARLLVVEDDSDAEPIVELAHEAVFRHWPRLAGWIDEEHEHMLAVTRMRRAAAEWSEAGQDPIFLWPQERIEVAQAAVDHTDAGLAEHERAFLRPEADRLLAELVDAPTTHSRRREISMRICALGDRRPGVGVRADGLPDIAWMAVQPPGRRSRPFWIAKYPVTISQLGAYRGQFGGAATRTGLEGRSASWPANCSGDEAVEFCWWLMAVREYTSAIGPAAAPSSYVIRLPTEREWMAAAKGGQASSAYPWGSDWDERRAHSKSSGLPEPLAVGMFPLGDSPDGISDLAGTVWEWCANEGGTATANLRVLKGGSRLSDPLECRIDARREMRGDVSRDDRGFRICCGPDPETA